MSPEGPFRKPGTLKALSQGPVQAVGPRLCCEVHAADREPRLGKLRQGLGGEGQASPGLPVLKPVAHPVELLGKGGEETGQWAPHIHT